LHGSQLNLIQRNARGCRSSEKEEATMNLTGTLSVLLLLSVSQAIAGPADEAACASTRLTSMNNPEFLCGAH
jgi:hypothetical protein